MLLLPKGKPLHENIAAAKINIPELLLKLKSTGFTGYGSFSFPDSMGILLFESGKLVSAMVDPEGKRQSGFEAIAAIFAQVLVEGGSINVYCLSNDLTMCLHALLHGEMLYKAQELKLIDVKGLLEKMKARRLNGCLRIYASSKTALIFYKEGSPLGFFHDGSQEMETSATESQKIAGLPGAKLDVLSTKTVDELMDYDLLEMVNVDRLWESSVSRHSNNIERAEREAADREQRLQEEQLKAVEADLKEIATAYVGKLGRALVEKELQERGGNRCLLDPKGAATFLLGVEKAAKLLISSSKLNELVKVMKTEIAKLARF